MKYLLTALNICLDNHYLLIYNTHQYHDRKGNQNMSVGANIKKRRYELRMSQQDLANALGYKTRSTIAKIESGENDISQRKLRKFADALDTTVDALIHGPAAPVNGLIGEASKTLQRNQAADRRKTAAVILAGGKSSRNHLNIPNQFINVQGKPVIIYCMEAYQAHPAVDDIYIVCLKGWEQIMTAYADQYRITKLRGLIPAASSGILSVQNGLNHIKDRYSGEDMIIFQESTRPMVSTDMISKLLQACHENEGANICQSMKDYVQFSCTDGKARYLDRNTVVDLQSPEAYTFRLISEIFDSAEKAQHPLTESCCAMLMYNLGYPIHFIEGSINNIKIIRQDDIPVFETLLRRQT